MNTNLVATLPVYNHIGAIISMIAKNQVVILCSATGSGKTTVTPIAALDEFPNLPVFITQHRRLMVRRNGERMAQIAGCRPGGLVGWQLSRETPVVSRETRLKLLMEQTLINQLRGKGGEIEDAIYFMDEVHGRRKQTDFLFGIFKEALPKSPKSRLVIMSATINAKEISDFFGGAPIYNIDCPRLFPVETKIHRLERHEHHSQGAERCAREFVTEFLKGGVDLPASNGEGREHVTEGTAFVILPGKEDLRSVRGGLERFVAEQGASDRVEFFTLHSESDTGEQNAAFAPIRKGVLRIVVGTEILREGITHPSLICVIDSLEKKRKIRNAEGIGGLDKVAVSRAEAEQALGRLGRVRSGRHYIVSFLNEYEGLRSFPQPELEISTITEVALGVADLDRNLRTFPLITRPTDQQIAVAIKRLQRVGALDENETITDRGRLLIQFPVDEPEQGVTFIEADKRGVLPEAVIALAIKNGEGFSLPQKGREVERTENGNDFVELVRTYRAYKNKQNQVRGRRDQLREWCEGKRVNMKRIEVVDTQVSELVSNLEDAGFDLGWPIYRDREFSPDDMAKSLVAGLLDNISVPTKRGYTSALGDFSLARESSVAEGTSVVLVGGLSKIPTDKGFFYLGTMAIAIHPEWLPEVVPQLCKRVRKADFQYDDKEDVVTETEELFYGDLKLSSKRVKTNDRTGAAKCLASWASWYLGRSSAPSNWKIKPDFTPKGRFLKVAKWNEVYNYFANKFAIRAGQPVIPTLTNVEWQEAFAKLTGHATRLAEVKNFDLLKYPAPNAQDICEALELNPLATVIPELGEEPFEVVYPEKGNPHVVVKNIDVDFAWLKLNDNGYLLPSGRALAVKLTRSGGYSHENSDILTLKAEATDKIHEVQFGNWRQVDRPAILLPDYNNPETKLAEIKVVEFAKSQVSGIDLFAYGTVIVNPYRSSYDNVEFKTEWFRDRTKAEDARNKAVAKLAELQAKAAEERRRQDLRGQAEKLKSQVGTAYSTYGDNPDFVATVRAELRDLHNKYTPSSIPEIEAFIQACKAVLARVQEELAKVAEIDAKVAAGYMLRNFTAWHRRGGATNNGDGWVICPDGTRRSSDSNDVPHHKYDGNFTWRLVQPEELALRWNGGTHVEVVKMPVGEITDEQLVAVKEIEQEIGVPEGLFGFNTDILTKNEERLDAIDEVLKRVLGQIPTHGEYEGAPYYEFVDFLKGHVTLDVPENLMRKVNQANEPNGGYASRNSYIVLTLPAADGVVEFHIFHKFGHWNLGILWRETSDQVAEVESVVPPQSQPKPTSPANKKQGDFTSLGDGWFRCNACNRSESFFVRKEWKALNPGEGKEVACTSCGGIAEVKK